MNAFKSSREGNDPVSGHPWTERQRKLKSGLTFELCTAMARWPSLLGKGYLIHVEAEATTTDAVPSAHGRGSRDASASLRRHPTRLFHDSHAGRQGNRSRRCAVDPETVWAGAISVVGTNGDTFDSTTQNLKESIMTITVAGSISTETRLVGTVKPSSNGDANVYFENLNVTDTGELGKIDVGQVSNFRTVQNGIYAIDMPNFYLAHTETTTPSVASLIHTIAMSAGQIDIPEGVNTLRFGGVDVDYTPAGGTPLNQTRSKQRVPDQSRSAHRSGDEHHRQLGQQRRGSQFDHEPDVAVPGLRDLPGHRPVESLPGQHDHRQYDTPGSSALAVPQPDDPVTLGRPGWNLRHLAGWRRHGSDRHGARGRGRDQLHDLRHRRSARRGRIGRPARRQDHQLLHRRPDR